MKTSFLGAVMFTGVVASLTATPATSGDWFMHKFGELRSYHGDWLAVCADSGRGACRIVASGKDQGSDSVFDYRFAAHYVEGLNEWNIEVMDRGMPESQLTAMRFDFDGEWINLPYGSWKAGEMAYDNVMETVTLIDFPLTKTLIGKMKAGTMLSVTYAPQGWDGLAQFSLRGVTAAMHAVEMHVRHR